MGVAGLSAHPSHSMEESVAYLDLVHSGLDLGVLLHLLKVLYSADFLAHYQLSSRKHYSLIRDTDRLCSPILHQAL